MFKKLFLTFILVASLFAVAGCEAEPVPTEGTGYGLVHAHYVGVVNVTVGVDGKLSAIDIDEYFLPYSWAKVLVAYAANEDVLTVVGSRGTSYYAKYIKIGTKLFTGEVLGTGTAMSINYKADGVANIETWMKQEAAAKWYVEQVDADAFFIATATGTQHATYVKGVADTSTAVSMLKSTSGYWTGASYPLGWTGNMTAFKTALIGQDLTQVYMCTRDTAAVAGSQFWTINGIVSGATFSDMPDYLEVSIRAFRNAK